MTEVKEVEESRKEVEEMGKEVEESASEDEWLRIDSDPASEAAWLEGVSSLSEDPDERSESTEGDGDAATVARAKEGTRSCFSTKRSATPIWLSPKSMSLMNPLLSMRMLSGFRSRWITCSSSWR